MMPATTIALEIVAAMLLAAPAYAQQAPPSAAVSADGKYEPRWESLDTRPNPAWFDDDKIGIFIHWSVFSVPAVAWVYPDKPYVYGGLSCLYELYIDRITPLAPPQQAKFEEFHRKTYGNATFRKLAASFKAEAFDPNRWADLFKRSGARYAFVTSNFHDGYCLWPSPYSPGWNSMDVGPNATAGRFLQGDATRLRGFYYSIRYPADGRSPGDLKRFVREHMQPQLREAVSRYSPSFIYFDGEWDFPLDSFEMQDFLAWLYNDSPCKDDVVVNDRFGAGSRGKHGGVYCSEAGVLESGTKAKWCEDRPISRGNWSYNRLERLEDYSGRARHDSPAGRDRGPGRQHALRRLALRRRHDPDAPAGTAGADGRLAEGQRRGHLRHPPLARDARRAALVPTYDPRLNRSGIWTVRDKIPQVQYTRKGDVLYAISLAWPGKTLTLENPDAQPEDASVHVGRRTRVLETGGRRHDDRNPPTLGGRASLPPCLGAETYRTTEHRLVARMTRRLNR